MDSEKFIDKIELILFESNLASTQQLSINLKIDGQLYIRLFLSGRHSLYITTYYDDSEGFMDFATKLIVSVMKNYLNSYDIYLKSITNYGN